MKITFETENIHEAASIMRLLTGAGETMPAAVPEPAGAQRTAEAPTAVPEPAQPQTGVAGSVPAAVPEPGEGFAPPATGIPAVPEPGGAQPAAPQAPVDQLQAIRDANANLSETASATLSDGKRASAGDEVRIADTGEIGVVEVTWRGRAAVRFEDGSVREIKAAELSTVPQQDDEPAGDMEGAQPVGQPNGATPPVAAVPEPAASMDRVPTEMAQQIANWIQAGVLSKPAAEQQATGDKIGHLCRGVTGGEPRFSLMTPQQALTAIAAVETQAGLPLAGKSIPAVMDALKTAAGSAAAPAQGNPFAGNFA